ncbi:MAG: DNA gyrase inhibitor YacG [Usitatibacter sp.]
MSAAAGPRRVVACPGCGKPAPLAPSNPWRPFCSERCRLSDLGAWASESYRVPAKPAEGEGGPEGGEPEA